LNLAEAVVKGFDYPGTDFAHTAVGALDVADPGMLPGGFLNNLGGPIGGTVIDQDIFGGANRLIDHALDGPGKIFFFIAHR
jgi:hypothetical protein